MPDNVACLKEMIRACRLCPRACGVDRTAGQRGSCGVGDQAIISSVGPHFGEESCLVGPGGSGAIFFAGCNLHCVFCQNAEISQCTAGQPVSPEELAEMALDLERRGCQNVNFVTPTHVTHAVAEAIVLARRKSLRIPVVYNCSGYESLETIRCLDGLIDIYMPDFKWGDEQAARKYSQAPDYPAVAAAALTEMFHQVGRAEINGQGVMVHGLLVRHLVLPGDLAHSRTVLDTVARIAPGCAINVMDQYRPCHHADRFPELLVRPPTEEVGALRQYAQRRGLIRADV
ncbi:MAG TPA: radical SAM protein [Phycisphaerales bacterium]|nr:radical SAM protein [Phycisphaerales bacterium]